MMQTILPWIIGVVFLYTSREMWRHSKMLRQEPKAYWGIAGMYMFFSVFIGLYGFIMLYGLIRGLM